MKLRSLSDAPVQGKHVLLRLDLNVPMKNGVIQDDTRLQAALPTLHFLLEKKSKIIILTHLGRPKGKVVDALRVDPLAKALALLLNKEVQKLDDCRGENVRQKVNAMKEGEILLLENTRFHPEEVKNDPAFSEELATLATIYVDDAFGAVHRAHASTVGVAKLLPSYAGFLIESEIKHLSPLLEKDLEGLCLIVGGAKIDTKIGILERFLGRADAFLIGGALANTFIAAQGYDVRDSLFQKDKLPLAKRFLEATNAALVPTDLIVSKEISNTAETQQCTADRIPEGMKILDLGPETIQRFLKVISQSRIIVWNGPLGLYEFAPFQNATKQIAAALVQSSASCILGGGDTIDAIKTFGYHSKDFTHVSTGGGAMLEFLEGKPLPGLEVLAQ